MVIVVPRIGRLYKTFHLKPGDRIFSWDLRDEQGNKLPAGYYVLRLKTGSDVLVEKLIVH